MARNPSALILLASLLLFVGCKHNVAIAPPPEPARGESSFRVLVEPSAGEKVSDNGWTLVPPTPTGQLSLPVYPPKALERKYGAAAVAVRIIIDVDGRVTKITDSPRMVSTPGPIAADFRAAVEAAIQSWRFRPAEWQLFEAGKDLDGDGKPDYQKLYASEKVSAYVDVLFDFFIVAGKGEVRQTNGGQDGAKRDTKRIK